MTYRIQLRMLALFVWALALPLSAHEGVEHHEPAFDAAAPTDVSTTERPHRLADGSMFVPKSMQRLLQIRTAIAGSEPARQTAELVGEVALQPEAGTQLTAPQVGRLEAPQHGWPVAGQPVQAGETLAWLQPLLIHRDAAKRRARIGDIDQKLALAQLNVDRIGLQNEANQGRTVAGNIYLEQAQAELSALQQQRALLAAGLVERLPLRAAVSGRVISVPRSAGDAVVAGQAVIELADPSRLRLVATTFDPRPVDTADVLLADGRTQALRHRATEPLADRPGWQLLFDPVDAAGLAELSPGEPVRIVLRRRRDANVIAIDPLACVRDAQGHAQIWVHVAPEQFAARPIEHCDSIGNALVSGERIVVAGAALLSQYL